MARTKAPRTGKAKASGKTNRTKSTGTTMPPRQQKERSVFPDDEFGFYSDTPAAPAGQQYEFPPEQFEVEEEPMEAQQAEEQQPAEEPEAAPRRERRAPRKRKAEPEPKAVVSPAGTLWNFVGFLFTGGILVLLILASIWGGEDIKNSNKPPVTPPPIVTPAPVAPPEEPSAQPDGSTEGGAVSETPDNSSPIEVIDPTPVP